MDNRLSFTRGDMHVLTYSLNQSTCLMAHLLLPHTMLPSVKQIVPTASNWSSSEDLRKNRELILFLNHTFVDRPQEAKKEKVLV